MKKSPPLKRFISLETKYVKPIDDLKFDLKFEQSLVRAKSDSDLSEVVIDIPGLNTFTPKKFSGFSQKLQSIFWDLLSEEEKGKFESLKSTKKFDPLLFLIQSELDKLSKDNQSIPFVNPVATTAATPSVNPHINISQGTTSEPFSKMANRYVPLALLANLNVMPTNYNSKIKQFGADEAYTAKQHVQWFKDFRDLLEIYHEDLQMRHFA